MAMWVGELTGGEGIRMRGGTGITGSGREEEEKERDEVVRHRSLVAGLDVGSASRDQVEDEAVNRGRSSRIIRAVSPHSGVYYMMVGKGAPNRRRISCRVMAPLQAGVSAAESAVSGLTRNNPSGRPRT